jgi:hypothetical protein
MGRRVRSGLREKGSERWCAGKMMAVNVRLGMDCSRENGVEVGLREGELDVVCGRRARSIGAAGQRMMVGSWVELRLDMGCFEVRVRSGWADE